MFDILQKAALSGSEVLLRYFRTAELDILHKTDHHNIVTKADKESQKVIKTIILEEMEKKGIAESEIGFIGEEDLFTEGQHSHIFVIDPLDGTSNFASGLDVFCIPIGYFYKGELTAGLIIRPTHTEIYYAEKGKGAFLIRKGKKYPLRMKKGEWQNTFILTEAWTDLQKSKEIEVADMLVKRTRGIRILGSAALDIVALCENMASMLIFEGPYIWDLAAGKIILNEAGGELYDFEGNLLHLDVQNPHAKYEVIGCHREEKQHLFHEINGS